MLTRTAPWFHSLTESVHALDIAAREYRTAHQAATVAAWNLEPARLLPLDGLVNVPERHYVSPHDDAVTKLTDAYRSLETHTRKLYENTAPAYAYGTASVLQAVLLGERPSHIALSRRDGLYVRPAPCLPDLSTELRDWPDVHRLIALRQDVIERERAAAVVQDWSFYADLADCQDPDLTAATNLAAGLADTAFAYGETAESALHHTLMTARSDQLDEADGPGEGAA
ncbi:hypothetical protein [Streptomyces odontomachi]|uniref:hypothetical protein n=1 Tax=Streptomyces odontomachi TaxID=2944940 RepID=UPI00210B7728|nr:hypothetical protein [Streptomyces sp. ODS25]